MRAYTLIELLLVFAVALIIAVSGISLFSSFHRSQVFESGVAEFSSFLRFARSRAVSQVKPANCGSEALEGYRVEITPLGQEYRQVAVCGASSRTILTRKLPTPLTFMNSSAPSIMYQVSTGTVPSPGAIVITNGLGKTTTITVDKIGNSSTGEMIPNAQTPNPTSSTGVPTPGPNQVLPDLAVSNIATNPISPAQGAIFQILITIRNQGAGSFTGVIPVGIYYNRGSVSPTYSSLISAQAAIAGTLAPGQSQTATFPGGRFTTSGSHDIYSIVDYRQMIPESNETNNLGGPHGVNVAP